MGPMQADAIFTTAFVTVINGALGTLFWSRLNRIEGNMADMATRQDVDRLFEEMAVMRHEQAVMRSDLTHVALAVGARRSKASEG